MELDAHAHTHASKQPSKHARTPQYTHRRCPGNSPARRQRQGYDAAWAALAATVAVAVAVASASAAAAGCSLALHIKEGWST
uniref:Uncharacterized protein n=1 Tax=Physcomitrium patens TaxID=3218 RepID=A0A2K1KKH2_PHYPA|nr:hypothetical protein PHYPA_007946 [Physcomitrium patens]